jgi:hypothetical protein
MRVAVAALATRGGFSSFDSGGAYAQDRPHAVESKMNDNSDLAALPAKHPPK